MEIWLFIMKLNFQRVNMLKNWAKTNFYELNCEYHVKEMQDFTRFSMLFLNRIILFQVLDLIWSSYHN